MTENDLKDLYEGFKKEHKINKSVIWDDQLKKWEPFYKEITEGLKFERWMKNDEEGYLPDFLDTKEKFFGHARIGNYDQVMIYKYSGKDKNRQGQYFDKYQKNSTYKEEDVKKDYEKNIQPLLKEIVDAKSLDDIYKAEISDNYKNFSCKQILRKITILMSVMDDNQNYKNKFLWIFKDKKLENLAQIFEIDFEDDVTFFEKNNKIFEKINKLLNINTYKKEDYIMLNDFVWYLSNSVDFPEFYDFNSCNLIINGAPGTGKTYGVINSIKKLNKIKSEKYKEYKYIQFHPSFTYQDFIEGIKPMKINNGNVELQVVNGCFKQFCIKVKKENEKFFKQFKKDNNKEPEENDYPHYYFVVDEINRGNLSRIFGETFTLLETDYRDKNFSGNYDNYDNKEYILMSTPLSEVISKIENNDDLIYKKVNGEIVFGIPFNIHFIGIMNDVDRSIDPFDLAFRRRFKWKAMYCDYDVIENELEDKEYNTDDIADYVKSCKKLNDFITENNNGLGLGKSYEIGHSFFLKITKCLGNKIISKNKKKEVFDNYILGTLKEHIRQVKDENEIEGCVKTARIKFGIEEDGKKE